MNAQINFKTHKINHIFTYGVVDKNLHPIQACMQKKFIFKLFWLNFFCTPIW